jgi:hypothetical protein
MTQTMTQTWFATIALLSWPLVALWLFRALPLNQAIVWTILGGLLLLPVGAAVKLAPGIPQLDKISIPSLAAVFGCILTTRRLPRLWHGIGLAEILLLGLLTGPFITSELNGDAILTEGGIVLPPVDHYDGLSAVVAQFLFILPFFLGRQFFRNSADNEEILRILVIAGLLYSLPMLFEVRMSPQLGRWLYGFSPSFVNDARYGGFRPVVFLGNGLVVASFIATVAVAAAAFWRTQTRVKRLPAVGVTAYLTGVLILCKSAAALLYGVALVPLVRATKPRLQLGAALVIVSLAMLHPLLRAADLFPDRYLVHIATTVFGQQRADSLNTRFEQEQQLLTHASERFLFGWGRFGRNRVYDKWGKDVSLTDGRWIITMGTFGFFGFLTEFGLLTLCVVRAAASLKFNETMREKVFFAALVLIVAISVLDQLPNASLSPWTWLLAGTLMGRADALRAIAQEQRKSSIAPKIGRREVSAVNSQIRAQS